MSDQHRAAAKATLATNVRRLRIASRVSLSQLAAATDVGKATLSGIENARGNATLDTIVAIAAALRVTPAELLEPPVAGGTSVVRGAGSRTERGPAGPGLRLDDVPVDGAVAVWELRLEPSEVRELDPVPAGRRGVRVISGAVLAGPLGAPVHLDPGDYLSCPAEVATAIEALEDPVCLLLLLLG